jgi:hypothetical protein
MWLWKRLQFLRELPKQPFVRLLILSWAASGIWDLALSEWIPEKYSSHLPRVYQVVAMTTGLLSWQLWILAGAMILALACLEYAFRRSSAESAESERVSEVTDASYRLSPLLYGIILIGLLAVIFGVKILYDRSAAEIQHPAVTYHPENDMSVAHIARPTPSQSLPQPRLLSTAFHEIYKCQYHWPAATTPKEQAEALAKIKLSSKTMESVFGVSVKWRTTDDSLVVELTPLDPSNIRVLGGMVRKLTEEIRYLNDDYSIVVIIYDVPGPIGTLLGLMPPPDIPGARDQQRKLAANLLQVADDKCELL